METENKNLLTTIKQFIPTVETIAEAYVGDEIILTRLEVKQLMKHVDADIPIKITMMDFTNTTFEDALCKLNSQY